MTVKQITARLQEHNKLVAKNAEEAGKALIYFTKLLGVKPKRANAQGDAHLGGTVYFAPVMIGKVLSRVLLRLDEGNDLNLWIEPKGSGKVNDTLREMFDSGKTSVAQGRTASALVRDFAKEAAKAAKKLADCPDQGVVKTMQKWSKVSL